MSDFDVSAVSFCSFKIFVPVSSTWTTRRIHGQMDLLCQSFSRKILIYNVVETLPFMCLGNRFKDFKRLFFDMLQRSSGYDTTLTPNVNNCLLRQTIGSCLKYIQETLSEKSLEIWSQEALRKIYC